MVGHMAAGHITLAIHPIDHAWVVFIKQSTSETLYFVVGGQVCRQNLHIKIGNDGNSGQLTHPRRRQVYDWHDHFSLESKPEGWLKIEFLITVSS